MMAGKPRRCNMISSSTQDNHHHHQSSTSSGYLPVCPSLLPQYHQAHRSSLLSSSLLSLNSSNFVGDDDVDDQDQFPHSWSQLLASGLANEEEIILNQSSIREVLSIGDIKHENSQRSHLYYGNNGEAIINDHELRNDHQNTSRGASNWSHQQVNIQSPSPKSSITSLGSNLLDFSSNKRNLRSQIPDQLSECNSTSTGGVSKKARVHTSSTQPPLKVRKEKLGDRITALHQLVSPFGKTDTASVLLEVIGYIRFLQGQIEALSSPYLCNASTNMRHHHSGKQDGLKDLKSRGLCLVPVSCTRHVSNDNGADYWGRSPGGGF